MPSRAETWIWRPFSPPELPSSFENVREQWWCVLSKDLFHFQKESTALRSKYRAKGSSESTVLTFRSICYFRGLLLVHTTHGNTGIYPYRLCNSQTCVLSLNSTFLLCCASKRKEDRIQGPINYFPNCTTLDHSNFFFSVHKIHSFLQAFSPDKSPLLCLLYISFSILQSQWLTNVVIVSISPI